MVIIINTTTMYNTITSTTTATTTTTTYDYLLLLYVSATYPSSLLPPAPTFLRPPFSLLPPSFCLLPFALLPALAPSSFIRPPFSPFPPHSFRLPHPSPRRPKLEGDFESPRGLHKSPLKLGRGGASETHGGTMRTKRWGRGQGPWRRRRPVPRADRPRLQNPLPRPHRPFHHTFRRPSRSRRPAARHSKVILKAPGGSINHL